MRLTNRDSANRRYRHEHIHIKVVLLEEADCSITEDHPTGDGQNQELQYTNNRFRETQTWEEKSHKQ